MAADGQVREQAPLYPRREVLVGSQSRGIERCQETPLRKEGRGVHLSKKILKDEVSFMKIHGTV